MTKNYTTIDLFAGVGGISQGFSKNGFKTIFSNDFDNNCKYTYDLNNIESKLLIEDFKKLNFEDIPNFDWLLAGFPCQAFSIAGHRQGFKDEKGRGDVFFDIVKLIKQKRPRGFLLENVKNLIKHDDGNTFKIIMESLQSIGYYIAYKVMNTMDYGNIPQNRERIYIVGFDDFKSYSSFNFPESTPLTVSFKDFLEEEVDDKYYYNNKPLFDRIKDEINSFDTVYQWRRQYVRSNKKGVCPTLTANMGTGGHNVPIIKDSIGIRKLTPKECFMLQGFSSDFIIPALSDSILYKQAGNSVSVPVINKVAKQIRIALENNSYLF
jgi:DNA (cytosine-5)-methyltransferase 1